MRRLATLALGLWLAAGVARGEGYPIPRGEHALAWKAEQTVGDWRIEGEALSLAKPRVARNFFFQEPASSPAVPYLRARIQNPVQADVAILFRTKVRAMEPLLTLTGYGFYLEGRKETFGFARYNGTSVDDTGARTKVKGLSKVAELEIVLFTSGPAFAAHIYDARTKQELGSLVWSDAAFPEGAVGVYANRVQPPEVKVTVYVPDAPGQEADARDGLPPDWLVRVDRGVVLPDEARRLLRRAAREEDADVYIGSELGVYLLRERGIPLREVRPGAPFRFSEADFAGRLAQARKAAPREAFVEGIKDPELVELAMRSLAARHPALTRIIEVGRTHENRPILGLVVGEALDDASRPAVLLCGAHHANEVVTPEPPLDAARWLLDNPEKDPRVARWLRTFHVVVVPIVNIDGSHGFWHESIMRGRTNRRRDAQAQELKLFEYGVDLNRNYPFQWGSVTDRFNTDEPRSPFYRGPTPGSEPEVQAMMKLGETWRFVAMVSYHSAASRLLVPYTVDARETTPSAAWAVAPEMIAASGTWARNKRYEAVRRLYPVSGTDQDWFYWSFGTLAYLVELPFSSPGPNRPLAPMIAASRPLWQVLMERFVAGPSLTVRVPESMRAEGPVTVAIEEIRWGNGERFTAHPEAGVFHTYLPAAGRYTVRATSPSGKTVSRAVEVKAGRLIVTLEEDSGPAN